MRVATITDSLFVIIVVNKCDMNIKTIRKKHNFVFCLFWQVNQLKCAEGESITITE